MIFLETERKPPKVVSHQKLRNLRHYYGQLDEQEIFTICEHCSYTWTHNEFVQSYLVNKRQIPNLKELGLEYFSPKLFKAQHLFF